MPGNPEEPWGTLIRTITCTSRVYLLHQCVNTLLTQLIIKMNQLGCLGPMRSTFLEANTKFHLLWEWSIYWTPQGFPSVSGSKLKSKQATCHCVACVPTTSISVNRHCLCFPWLRNFRMNIVRCIQCAHVILKRGMGPVIREQEMTCNDHWWPQRERGDLRLTQIICVATEVG